MWMQALMLTPYIAIAASGVLAATVATICFNQPARASNAGFTV
jgi:hypothetical protein